MEPVREALRQAGFASPLAGWAAIDAPFLFRHRGEPTSSDLLSYFDGRVPTWSLALSTQVPRRALTTSIVAGLRAAEDRPDLQLRLIVGASGEGKTTFLMQAAADVASSLGFWRVLWREPGASLSIDWPSRIAQGSHRWLLVSDDAETIPAPVFTGLRHLREQGRRDVSVVLAARDTDWRAVGGDRKPWASYADVERYFVRGLSEPDARLIVDAWRGLGEPGLGQLMTSEDPVQALLDAARAESVVREGAFLGGMLRARVGGALEERVRSLMGRLLERDDRLLRAFLLIAAPHAVGVQSLSPEILMVALGLTDVGQLRQEILLPLGEEAAASATSQSVLIRHRSIAETAIGLCETLGVPRAPLFEQLVRAAIVDARRRGIFTPSHEDIAYISGALLGDPELADSAARAATEANPRRLSFIVQRSYVLRETHRETEALSLLEATSPRVRDFEDFSVSIPAFLFEWAVAAGQLGHSATNAVLGGASISDWTPSAELDPDIASKLAGMALAFANLEEAHGGFAEALRAAAEIGLRLKPRTRTQRFLVDHAEHATALGLQPVDDATMLADLESGVRNAGTRCESSLPRFLPSPSTLTFRRLGARLAQTALAR